MMTLRMMLQSYQKSAEASADTEQVQKRSLIGLESLQDRSAATLEPTHCLAKGIVAGVEASDLHASSFERGVFARWCDRSEFSLGGA